MDQFLKRIRPVLFDTVAVGKSAMNVDKIHERWQGLDPIFIRGAQRSGTSILSLALSTLGINSFGEGHLWDEVLLPFQTLSDAGYLPDYRHESYTLGREGLWSLREYIAVAIDDFHRNLLDSGARRWADKSPGALAVRRAGSVAESFPKSQFLFVYRNGITVVHSGVRYWPDQPDIFETMCQLWAETMSEWRSARDNLAGRFLEISQENIASNPEKIAADMAVFLNLPYPEMAAPQIAEVFRASRHLSSFEGKSPADCRYEIDWTDDQRKRFTALCGHEMECWGFDIDFEDPQPPKIA